MKLSVIIVNYNVKHYLIQCIDSVRKASKGIDVETIVVDNNSSDNSVEILRKLFPDIKIIHNKKNAGFSRANNQAISVAKGEYVLLLNPDTFVGENTFKDCLSLMDSKPNAAATGVKMLRTDGSFANESRRGVPTPFVAFCKMSGLCSLFPKNKTLGKYYMGYLDKDKVNEIEIISGAFMLIRRSCLQQTGLLDEQFFMYGEDIDLSYRLLQSGKKNYYTPTPILHYKGESTQKSSYKYVYVFYQAMIIFFKKHFNYYGPLVSLPIKTAIYYKAFTTFINNQFKSKQENGKTANRKYMQKRTYIFLGKEENYPAIKSISEKYGINVEKEEMREEILREGHNKINGYEKFDYVIYDTSLFSYSKILDFFSKSSKRHAKIGTFLPEYNLLLTDYAVFENSSE